MPIRPRNVTSYAATLSSTPAQVVGDMDVDSSGSSIEGTLDDIISLPSPAIICVDMNVHYVLWGSPYIDRCWVTIHETLAVLPLIILNTGTFTGLNIPPDRSESGQQLQGVSKNIEALDGVEPGVHRLAKAVDLSSLDASEEDKIQAMMTQSTQDYNPSNYMKIRGANQIGEVPVTYRCYKCHQQGHWIKNCPLSVNQRCCHLGLHVAILLLKDSRSPNQRRHFNPEAAEVRMLLHTPPLPVQCCVRRRDVGTAPTAPPLQFDTRLEGEGDKRGWLSAQSTSFVMASTRDQRTERGAPHQDQQGLKESTDNLRLHLDTKINSAIPRLADKEGCPTPRSTRPNKAVRLDGVELRKLQNVKYLGSGIEEKGGSREDLTRRGQQAELFHSYVRDLLRRRGQQGELFYRPLFCTPYQDLKLDLAVIGSPVYCKSDTSDHMATRAEKELNEIISNWESASDMSDINDSDDGVSSSSSEREPEHEVDADNNMTQIQVGVSSQDPIEIKKSTGIPRSFMVPVDGPSAPGAMMTPTGQFAVPAIDHQAYKEGKKERPPFQQEPEPVMEKPEIPEDLLCTVCKDLLTDAVMIPCCGNSFCDECIRTVLLESEEHECPDCKEKDVSPDTLIPNRFLRNAVNNFKNETGYHKTTMRLRQLQPVAPVIQIAPSGPIHMDHGQGMTEGHPHDMHQSPIMTNEMLPDHSTIEMVASASMIVPIPQQQSINTIPVLGQPHMSSHSSRGGHPTPEQRPSYPVHLQETLSVPPPGVGTPETLPHQEPVHRISTGLPTHRREVVSNVLPPAPGTVAPQLGLHQPEHIHAIPHAGFVQGQRHSLEERPGTPTIDEHNLDAAGHMVVTSSPAPNLPDTSVPPPNFPPGEELAQAFQIESLGAGGRHQHRTPYHHDNSYSHRHGGQSQTDFLPPGTTGAPHPLRSVAAPDHTRALLPQPGPPQQQAPPAGSYVPRQYEHSQTGYHHDPGTGGRPHFSDMERDGGYRGGYRGYRGRGRMLHGGYRGSHLHHQPPPPGLSRGVHNGNQTVELDTTSALANYGTEAGQLMTHWKHSSACCGKKIAGTANFAELAGLAPILARAVGAALDRRDPTLTPGVCQGLGHAADRGRAHHALALGAPANDRGPRAVQGQEVAHSPSAGPHHAANATTRRQLNSLPLRVQPISGFFAMSKLAARAFGLALCATYNESSQTESYQSAGPPRAPLGHAHVHFLVHQPFGRIHLETETSLLDGKVAHATGLPFDPLQGISALSKMCEIMRAAPTTSQTTPHTGVALEHLWVAEEGVAALRRTSTTKSITIRTTAGTGSSRRLFVSLSSCRWHGFGPAIVRGLALTVEESFGSRIVILY
uniref:E3 ubiquitin-protein ligase RBBP6 n=2 Tax=Timema TaxID=61471 RepID=A0A7R8VH09_TIMDO|nr:unnamed protein product [Timema douglasi]